jgi:crotonobetainyl-CoA:carnitine CoA-transferase CaiB-like acyl-CoA transferase
MDNRTGLEGALAGTRVVEWSAGRPAAYAGKLLRGLGAEVTLLERPGTRERAFDPGPVERAHEQLEARIRFLHGGKRSVEFDPADAASRDLAFGLLSTADILVMDQHLPTTDALGLAPEPLGARFPQLVLVSISLGGLGARARAWRHSDLVAHAVGGTARSTPSRVPDVERYPPLKSGGYQADYACGLHAASAALLGLQLRRRTGAGQVIDVSAQAVFASYVRMDIAYRTYGGADALNISGASRQSPNGRFSTIWGLVPCSDGYFAFQASEQYQWEGLMRVMGDPDWAKDPRFADPMDRVVYWDEIEPHFAGWCLGRTKSEIFHAAQAEHVPVFPCYTVEELLQDEQQRARAFFVDLPLEGGHQLVKVPGAVVQLEKTPWQPSFEPPTVGQHTGELRHALGVGS